MRYWTWFLIAAVSTAASSRTASGGQVVVSNLDQPPTGSVPETSASYLGQEFTAGGSFSVQTIVISLGNLDLGTGSFDVVAALYSTTNQTEDPLDGTMLGSFSPQNPIPAKGFANIQYDATSVINLNACSFYWFLLMPVGYRDSVVEWQHTDTSNSTGPGSVLDWGVYDLYGGVWGVVPSDPLLLQVNVAPEPSSITLICTGIPAVLLCFRWRRPGRPDLVGLSGHVDR